MNALTESVVLTISSLSPVDEIRKVSLERTYRFTVKYRFAAG